LNKIFYAYAVREDAPNNGTDVYLELPASPYELLDALDKLRLSGENKARFRVDEYYRFRSVAPFLSASEDLLELNALAQKLSGLNDRQAVAFEGLLDIESRLLKEAPFGLLGLIDIAHSTDCCHVVDEALNDSQLGRFCAENGFVPGADTLPDTIFDLLDFERIGREHRRSANGVLVERNDDHPGGYVERHSDLVRVYLDLALRQPDYTVLLEVSKGFFNDPDYDSSKTTQLKLPAASETLSAALDAVDVWDWREAGWCCLDCRVPSLMDVLSDEDDIHTIDQMARRLADMDPKTLDAYKALLEAADCKSLQQAEQLMDSLDQYIFSPQYGSPVDVAKGELSVILCEKEREEISPYLDLQKYGQSLIQLCGGVLTDYGLIERKDGQPIQTMEDQPRQGGMEMR